MSYSLSHGKPLRPKNPEGPLRVIMIGRVSTEHQHESNIEASYLADERYLKSIYTGEMEIKRLGERGSGWKIHRATIKEAEDEIRTRSWDVVIAEDLGRVFRNPEFRYQFAHFCVDHDTRLICPGDGIDTGTESWEPLLSAAVMRHSMTVPETRRRVRRTTAHSFHKGGMVTTVRFGYVRVSIEDAAAGTYGPVGLRIAKDPQCTPIILEMRDRVLRGDTYRSIADWLNNEEIPTGSTSRTGVWTANAVVSLLRCPLLHGLRVFRKVEHQIIYKTGDHRRIPNPNPETKLIPELAHMTYAEQQELWDYMDRYSPRKGEHKRKGTARKESLWPGQHLRCGVCGDYFYWDGGKNRMRCKNASPGGNQTCWNHVCLLGDVLRETVLPQLINILRGQPTVWNQFVDQTLEELRKSQSRCQRESQGLDRKISALQQDCDRIVDLLVKSPESPSLIDRLKQTEQEIKALQQKQREGEQTRKDKNPKFVSLSREELESQIEAVLPELARTSYRLASLLRRSFPDLKMIPVQAVDTGLVRGRIVWTFPGLEGGESPKLVVDAFHVPLHIRHAQLCYELRTQNPGLTFQKIAERLGIHKKMAHEAFEFAEHMRKMGVTEPYRELTEKPAQASRWHSHQNKKRRPAGNGSPPPTDTDSDHAT